MRHFEINDEIVAAIDDYHAKSLAMQRFHYEGNPDQLTESELFSKVDDPLIFNVPIYDMLDRRYAAFCSFLEAIYRKEKDPKNNGEFFKDTPSLKSLSLRDSLSLFYLFRLCGSGINYRPKVSDNPLKSHGFGNFWIVDDWLESKVGLDIWLESLDRRDTPFTDSKGYLLPQISYKGLSSGHLKHFIQTEIRGISDKMIEIISDGTDRLSIIQFVDSMNAYLTSRGFKKQNFVLSATAADIAEYYPELIDPKSSIYAGTNAKKCISAMFRRVKGVKQETFEIEAINFLADRYDSVPYSVEDSRLCDVYRYLYEFQSDAHVEKNGGKRYENRSILKHYCEISGEEYSFFIKNLLG